ncbi:MAG: biotin/lipoyl-binding protein [Coriobacteriia bacterium]|nr:biotin/lipoyl-binding protein [Coriobacteriia bacterium]
MAASRGLRRYRGWIAAGVLALVAGGAFLALRDSAAAEDTITYETETAALGTISVNVSGTGNVAVNGTTDVWPATAGTVATVPVAEGSEVATGDVLFTLDAASAEANTARALASLRQAQQSVTQATLQVTKAENALAALVRRSTEPSSTVTNADITAAEGEVDVAEAGLASARAQLATAQISYDDARAAADDLTVVAPCGGVVYTLAIEPGDTVAVGSGTSTDSAASGGMTATSASSSSGAPVVLAPVQPLGVLLTVNEVDLPALAIGQRADLEFDALSDLTATGKVYEIAEEGLNSSGVVTFDVWLSIDVADPGLRSGMSAAATIVTDIARDALIISNAALHSDGEGGYYVLVMDAGATEPRQVPVETGLASATQTQILSGLAEGDVVVTQTVDSTDTDTETPGGGMMVPGMGGGFRG